MSNKINNQERLNFYSNALLKFSKSKSLPLLFREIFKAAFLPYHSHEIFALFLKEINHFDYSYPEELGDAYEYLLSIMSTQGNAGQFRTPRHIIDFMVKAIDPKKEDRCFDPACGTGGFLVSSFKHILSQNQFDEFGLKNLMNNFQGHDIDPTMVRISQVNMYLHQFKNPKIFQYDALSNFEKWDEKFDVIFANPPFMSPKGGIKPHNKFSIKSSRSEVLFVDYIVHHLSKKGRAAIIVPEGIIFQLGISNKQLRKNLLENGLYAVVSLPSGIFKPYSSVKTSILFFDNLVAKKSEKIAFVKILNDGLELSAKRVLSDKNDLPRALEILQKFKLGQETKDQIATFIDKKIISKTDEYNLSGDFYQILPDYSASKWRIVKLKEICQTTSGGTPTSSQTKYYENGNIPWLRSGEVAQGFIFKSELFITPEALKKSSAKLMPINTVLVAMYGATAGQIGILKFDCAINQAICGLLPNEKFVSEFLFFVLKQQKQKIVSFCAGAAQGNISQHIIQNLEIPLPPIEVQKKIVSQLLGYQKIIEGAVQITQNWRAKVEINQNWSQKKLGNLLEKTNQKIDPKKCFGKVFYVGLENIESGLGLLVGSLLSDYKDIKSAKNSFKKGDILYGKLRPNLNKVWLANCDGICSTDILVLRPKPNLIANFYWYLLLDENFVNQAIMGVKGAQLPRVSFEYLQNLNLVCPDFATQKNIVAQIEKERAIVESARSLIEIYETKTKELVASLWN